MKNKTFEIDTDLAAKFDWFCRTYNYKEKQFISAAILHLMESDSQTRELASLRLSHWNEGIDKELKTPGNAQIFLVEKKSALPRLAAKMAAPVHATPARPTKNAKGESAGKPPES